jgi:competence protein ComEA
MKWSTIVSDYLSFTRRELTSVIILVFLILIIFLLPRFINQGSHGRPVVADTAWIAAAKKLEIKEAETRNKSYSSRNENDYAYQYDRSVNNSPSPQRVNLFYFDPNTLDAEGWKHLGLKEKTIQIIQNYLGKGGHFNQPEDLKKIYGLHPGDYSRLAPYVKIKGFAEKEVPGYVKKETEPKHYSYNIIEINAADTAAFISLPGIGSKLAARIINFRDKLGGFYSIEQVGETYGLADSVFQKIRQLLKVEAGRIKKININTATLEELKAHPYIKYNIANPLVAYRNDHGAFSKAEDVKKVMAVTDDVYYKIAPYITTQ